MKIRQRIQVVGFVNRGGNRRMKSKKWKEFDKAVGKCYLDMAKGEADRECWHQAFAVLKEIVAEEKSNQQAYGTELYQLDEATDFSHDVEGWLEDYLDMLDRWEEHERLLEVCNGLLDMFLWEEASPSDIKMMKASALGALGRHEDAARFCEQWLTEEPDNPFAAAASIYADMNVHELESAEDLIRRHIQKDTKCTEENDVLFTAASAFYGLTGNKKEKKRMDQALEEYDQYLQEYFAGGDGEEDMGEDWELPFE